MVLSAFGGVARRFRAVSRANRVRDDYMNYYMKRSVVGRFRCRGTSREQENWSILQRALERWLDIMPCPPSPTN
jgi:hypothetical protein